MCFMAPQANSEGRHRPKLDRAFLVSDSSWLKIIELGGVNQFGNVCVLIPYHRGIIETA